MTSGALPILSFHAQHLRVRIELTKSAVDKSPQPSPDLISRARNKLDAYKKDGRVLDYEVYEEKLHHIWSAIRAAGDLPEDQVITFTLAAGFPKLPWLQVQAATGAGGGIIVSVKDSISLKGVERDWVRTAVLYYARKLNHDAELFRPQLEAFVEYLYSGAKPDKFHISYKSSVPVPSLDGRLFTIVSNRNRGELFAYIGDMHALLKGENLDNLCQRVLQTIEKLEKSGAPKLRFLRQEMIHCIKSSVKGPESVKVGLPLCVLVAVSSQLAPSTKTSNSGQKKYFSCVTDAEQMRAKIVQFNESSYEDPAFVVNREFLRNQAQLSGVVFGTSDKILDHIIEVASQRKILNGLMIAEGLNPVAGEEPYLHFVYKDAPVIDDTESKVINIRDAQQRSIVRKGQVVAESRYRRNPVVGSDVLGEPLLPDMGQPLVVNIGEGILLGDHGKYVAQHDGLPRFENDTISVIRTLVHEGDVNLKTGNIYFDGPIEITGSVEKGAIVNVTGPVKINGTISGGTVIARESIEVAQSIVTGESGLVRSETRVQADFIENSRVECKGSVVANRSIVNSDVRAGGHIIALANDGLIGGGLILSRSFVHAANIGFSKGAQTIMRVGVDYITARRFDIRTKRLEQIKTSAERWRLEFREMLQRGENQLSLAGKQRRTELKDKLARVKSVVETAEKQLEAAKSGVQYDLSALIAASNVFASNCRIEIAGKFVALDTDMIAAAVSAKIRRDTHLLTYDEVRGEIETKLKGPPASDNKTKKAG